MDGGGGVVTFEVEGGKAGAFRVENALELIDISNNLGDTKSLHHPSRDDDASAALAGGARGAGIGDGMLRMSVGLEDPGRFCEDLEQALAKL